MQGYPGQPGYNPSYNQQSPYNPMTSADLTALAQQGYAQQQATLQAMQSRPNPSSASSSGPPPLPSAHMNSGAHTALTQMGGMGGQMQQTSGMHVMSGMGAVPPGGIGALQYAQTQSFGQQPMYPNSHAAAQRVPGGRPIATYKPTGSRITNESLKRYGPQIPTGQNGREQKGVTKDISIDLAGPEPWTDAVDEIDHRELAMQRFRTRQEILSDIFGPERLKDIPIVDADPWAGFGMERDALEARVAELERENEELERRSREGVSLSIAAS